MHFDLVTVWWFPASCGMIVTENSQPIVKLLVYKTVKCEVINVEFLSRDHSLNNFAIMVKRKCLKLLHSSKGMCRIDSQLEKIDTLWFLETPYTFFSIVCLYFIVLHAFSTLSPMFSGISSSNSFCFFGVSDLSFFVFVLRLFKKENIYF